MALDRLRKTVDVVFPDLPGNVFGSKASARAARQNCLGLWNKYLGLEAPTVPLNSLLPPVLYQDLNKGEQNGLFLNEALMAVGDFLDYTMLSYLGTVLPRWLVSSFMGLPASEMRTHQHSRTVFFPQKTFRSG